ncbi:MAG TPA: S-methyl-5-thioribose-1-phosphate isomerase [Candidatus Limnocylindrales bacterium]|nr:S-methyl-5-thioribose-1-phosphate isomerase [Candidatus Limnocylindrales bacterium]
MRTVFWHDNHIRLIDQKRIPWEFALVDLYDYQAVAAAILDMTVRGAPAIGATAAYGMALAARQSEATTRLALLADLETAGDVLRASRPTAVNLGWAVERQLSLVRAATQMAPDFLREMVLADAQRIADEDVATNQRIGEFGAPLIQNGDTVLHHCNTGALATVDFGTALGVIRAAHEQGKRFHVLLDETRPRLQGARLSAWELEQLGISYDIIPDSAAGFYMRREEIKLVLVGADRITANGDFANKIGTYQVAVLAKENDIPFYTVAPISTVDLTLSTGDEIPIEERDTAEVLAPFGCPIVPAHFRARNPAFDVTPHRYLSGIITEKGIVRAPFGENLKRAASGTLV